MTLLSALLWAGIAAAGPPQVCMSTVFGQPGDKLAGGRTLAGPYPKDITGVAHRWAPLGGKVLVCTAKKCATLIVVDRGPYGKRPKHPTGPKDKWFNACPNKKKCPHRKRPGYWKGCLDLTPSAGKLLEHNGGRERVKIWHLWRQQRRSHRKRKM